jgi:hypothetical protein
VNKLLHLINLHSKCILMAERARANPYTTADAWMWLAHAERLDAYTNSLLDAFESVDPYISEAQS